MISHITGLRILSVWRVGTQLIYSLFPIDPVTFKVVAKWIHCRLNPIKILAEIIFGADLTSEDIKESCPYNFL